MNYLETSLLLSSLSLQAILCGFVWARRAQRTLPLFAAFVCVSLISSIIVSLMYLRFGFDAPAAYIGFWISTYFYAAAFGLAIAELCRYGFRNYRGIWALVWRVLAILAGILIAHAVIDAWGQPNGMAVGGSTFLRDFAFSSITILLVLLFIRRYYGLALDPFQRLIAAGMCLTCAVDAFGYTIFRDTLTGYLYPLFVASQKALWPDLAPQVRRVDDIWSTIHLISFMGAMGIWCYAFRKPLPAMSKDAALLPADVYREMSPAINLRLATFNNRLTELLKP